MSLVIETKKLSKLYGDTFAVKDFNIDISEGQIYGFVGQNGAGKTTLIRMLTALTIPTSGSIKLFGAKNKSENELARKRIGSIVEMPSFYTNLSARQNLEYYRILYGLTDKKRVDNVLSMIGLECECNKLFRDFSLGMKQRLGIGLSILRNADLIILDEPTNGLDPTGIIELRNLIINLNKEKGTTFLISSHILKELYMFSTNYAFMHKGQLINNISAQELRRICNQNTTITVDNLNRAMKIISTHYQNLDYHINGPSEISLNVSSNESTQIVQKIIKENINVTNITQNVYDIENYYLSLIQGV